MMMRAGVLAAALWLASPLVAASASVPVDGVLDFTVLRNGSEIGYHRVAFRESGSELEVDIDILLEVGLGPITLYRYEHDNVELWHDGRLIRFASQTDNNGEDLTVTAVVDNGGMVIEGSAVEGGRAQAPFAVPTSYWNPDLLRGATTLVDTQNGRLLDVSVTPLGLEEIEVRGQTIQASRYRLQGDLKADVWYDAEDRWVKLEFRLKGADFEYVLR